MRLVPSLPILHLLFRASVADGFTQEETGRASVALQQFRVRSDATVTVSSKADATFRFSKRVNSYNGSRAVARFLPDT